MKTSDALYQQIYHKLLDEINRGVYAGGKQLPTEMDIAQRYYVSRITSKKAFTLLAQNGLIVRIPGRGTFVKKDCVIPTIAEHRQSGKRIIALVMGGYGSSFGLDIINGAVERSEELGMHLILKTTHNDQDHEAKILRSLMASNVSAIIVQPAHGELYNEVLLNAVYSTYPIVMIDRFMPGIQAPFVGVDNCLLSREAATKLIDCGHRNIALLALEDDHSSSIKERMQGFTDAFVNHQLTIQRDLWLMRISDRAKALGLIGGDPAVHETHVEVIADHLRRHPEITAIFGTEYSVSKAAWDAVRRVGKRIPEDISIVSFDFDSSYLGLHQMSHIKQPQKSIGQCAVDIVNDMLDGKSLKQRNYLMGGQWVEGDSIAPLLV